LVVFDMILDATVDINGQQVNITAPAVTVEVVPGYEVKLASATLETGPGSRTEVKGTVRREPTFQGGLVRVKAEDLPEGVDCTPVEVPADQTEFVLACQASRVVAPGSYPIRITSSAPDTGAKAKDEYKIADLNAKLVISATANAASR
jgi:hypothetical protein